MKIMKFIKQVLCRHKYEPFAYSPNRISATCVWKCTKCDKLKWRWDFIFYPADEVHDTLRLVSTGEIVYTEDIKRLGKISAKSDIISY